MTADLTNPIFTNEDAARAHLESVRWPQGPVCPHCGAMGNNRPLGGESMGAGWYYCGDCKDKFTVRMGSIFERSHIPLHKWLLAFHLMSSSKKGISAHQLHRMLGITYKSAWFLAHRIRECMKDSSGFAPIGGEGKAVEADETYIGRKEGTKVRAGFSHKRTVLALVERGGPVRTFHIDHANTRTVKPIVERNVHRDSRLMTDEANMYRDIGIDFAGHERVSHKAKEYVRGEAHTNTLEGYFSIFKRGMKGVYQHCGEQHLHRYLSEYEFRYNNRIALGINDVTRAANAVKAAEGRRLTYRQLDA
jgi:transposase-like protein